MTIILDYSLFFEICDILGTLAFATSGLRLAAAKDFDGFGAYVVGLTTAIGGGTLRDVLLHATPFWMTNPLYLICSAFALIWVIAFKKRLVNQEHTWFLFDAIGLGLFTVTGIERTLSMDFPYWVAIMMGTMTGAAGGVLRDVLINETPLIFRKDIYATACICGGILFMLCDMAGLPREITGVLAGIAVIGIRILAVRYHVMLPVLHIDHQEEESNNK